LDIRRLFDESIHRIAAYFRVGSAPAEVDISNSMFIVVIFSVDSPFIGDERNRGVIIQAIELRDPHLKIYSINFEGYHILTGLYVR
jgi:hypothetical protein